MSDNSVHSVRISGTPRAAGCGSFPLTLRNHVPINPLKISFHKKLILMIAAAVLSAGVAQAQKRIKDTIAPTIEQVETQKKAGRRKRIQGQGRHLVQLRIRGERLHVPYQLHGQGVFPRIRHGKPGFQGRGPRNRQLDGDGRLQLPLRAR